MSTNDFFFRPESDDSHSFTSEEKIVKAILKAADASQYFKTLLAECREETGVNAVNLSWFVTRYPSFPIWLSTRKVQWQRDVFGHLLKRFTNTPCFKAWEEVDEAKPEEDSRSAGCVFTWPSFGVCCIHQYSPSYLASADGIWITRKLPSFEERFVIEPLSQLLKTLSWQFPG
jgi:8-oxo-dGTP pyrophosphatase MutT (NUDIX family)